MSEEDYVIIQFESGELLTRVKSVLCRAQSRNQVVTEDAKNSVQFGDHSLDFETNQLLDTDNQSVSPISMEFDLPKPWLKIPIKC